jgi:peptidoglycan/LPS O-acetylase OafA/YrhL
VREPHRYGGPAMEQTGRLEAITWLKGLAILAVVFIHAELLAGTFFFLAVINRAVPTFLVLFGVVAALGWERKAREPGRVRDWYRRRLGRLLPGYFAMVLVCALGSSLAPRGAGLGLGALDLLLGLLGYSPWIGTSWFVTVILEYVLVLPLLLWLAFRLPAAVMLIGSALVTLISCIYIGEFVEWAKAALGTDGPLDGFYYIWVFGPRVLWHVGAGIVVGRHWGGRVGPRAALAFALLTLLGNGLATWVRGDPSDFDGAIRELTVSHLTDVPFALALLGLLGLTERLPRPIENFLTFCGERSWGIYLGHATLHHWVVAFGFTPFYDAQVIRAFYALGLLCGGIALAEGASWLWQGIPRRRVAL